MRMECVELGDSEGVEDVDGSNDAEILQRNCVRRGGGKKERKRKVPLVTEARLGRWGPLLGCDPRRFGDYGFATAWATKVSLPVPREERKRGFLTFAIFLRIPFNTPAWT